jgi:HSP20 family protein
MNLIPWRNKREGPGGGTSEAHPLARLRDEMDHAFERFWRDPWSASFADVFPTRASLGLRLNLAESDNDVTVSAELPGVDPKDVDISVSGNTLTIHGEKKEEKEDKKKDYHYVERSYGSFHRSVQLPSSVDPNKVDATYKNGVLTVTLAKHAEARPRRITVKHE